MFTTLEVVQIYQYIANFRYFEKTGVKSTFQHISQFVRSLKEKKHCFSHSIFTDGQPKTDNDHVDPQFPAWYYRDGFQYTVATECGCAGKDWKVRKYVKRKIVLSLGHSHLCSGLLMTSYRGFKARVDPLIVCFIAWK